jgi:DNA-directed RNA polymerase subunit RPC12/RpoP
MLSAEALNLIEDNVLDGLKLSLEEAIYYEERRLNAAYYCTACGELTDEYGEALEQSCYSAIACDKCNHRPQVDWHSH